MCIRVCRQTSRQSTFSGNAGQQDTHGVGSSKADTGQRIGGLCLQVIIHTDVKH
jgi:hypothetical protein